MIINKLCQYIKPSITSGTKELKVLASSKIRGISTSPYLRLPEGTSHSLSTDSLKILEDLNINANGQEIVNKLKGITVPIEKEVLETLTISELRMLEKNWQLFQSIGKQKFKNISTDIIEDGTLIHNTMIHNIQSILDYGLMTGQSKIKTGIAGSINYGNKTATPAALDTFIINGKQSIGTYFNPSNRSAYENAFIRGDFARERYRICFTIDKSRISNFEKYVPKGKGSDTHWTIPFGVPRNCVDRIIVSSKLPEEEVSNIIKMLEKRGLDIKIYNREGQLLYNAQKV